VNYYIQTQSFAYENITSRKAVSKSLQSQIQNFVCDNVYQGRVVVGNIDVHCEPLSFITTLEGHFEIATLPNTGGADKSLDRPERKQVTATEDFDFHVSYL